jgi:ABC-2 type transport system permease protein
MTNIARTFATLIQREIWEHKGGFVWTPLIVGGVLLVFLLLGAGSAFFWQLKIEGADAMAEGALKLAETQVPADKLRLGVDAFLWGTSLMWQSVMFVVLFFFCIGCLYDDRRDRSVLFWKSMPVSDLETVLSKLVFAVVVAPAFMLAAMALSQIVLLLVAGLMVMLKGASAWKLIWAHTNPFPVWGQLIAVQGVQALYLLPLYG